MRLGSRVHFSIVILTLISRFLVRFCGNLSFKLRYWGFTKPSGFAVFRNFRVIFMRFAVFLCYSVRCLEVILCDLAVFVPPLPLRPLPGELWEVAFFCSFWRFHGNFPKAISLWGNRSPTHKTLLPLGQQPMGEMASLYLTAQRKKGFLW